MIPKILNDCAEKNIKTAIVISAGFKEMGGEGMELEKEMAKTAEKLGITLLGPNCLGVMNAQADWNASFASDKPLPGNIAFVSQSGALGTAFLDWANKENVGFSKFVSLGNEAQITELEFLEYLKDDDDTKAILLYLEKVSNGKKFLELAKEITKKKPLVVLRAGRSRRGASAVASHTGSLAPSDKIFASALQQVGAISVDSPQEMFSLAKLFKLDLTKPLQKLVILTNGGGPSVNTADLIDFSNSLSLVNFSDETKKTIREVLPRMAAVGNPVDVIGDAGPKRYEDVLNILTQMEEIDAIITLVTPQMMTDPSGIANVLIQQHAKKPIIPVFMGGKTMLDGVNTLKNADMTSFNMPSDAVKSLDLLAVSSEKPKSSQETHKVHKASLNMMEMSEMQSILNSNDLPLEGVFIKSKEEIAKAISEIGDGPYAIKAISSKLVHKSDLHAVKLHLNNQEEILNTWNEMENYIEEKMEVNEIDGILIQKMITGVECIIGMKRDVTFGPTIIFGLGGIFVEILKDSSMRIAPITKEEAMKQIHSIKGISLLTGSRGQEPVNIEAVANIIVNLSQLATTHPETEEIDFNPVIATPENAHIVDARIMVK